MLKQLLSATKVIVLALVLSFGLSYAIAAWTPPTLPPPGGNTDAPINIGATPQTKVGGDICTTVSGTTKCIQDAGGSDNLGNHIATQALNMAGFGINNAGNINATGNAIAKFGPNSTWGAYLDVGGNGRTTTNASVVATNGNLHLDARNGYNTYLNYYSGGPIIAGGYIDARPNNIYAGDVYSSTAGKWMSQLGSTSSFSTTGYTRLSDGLILQWVTYPTGPCGVATPVTINFPIAFPNTTLFVQGREYGSGGNGSIYREVSWTNSSVTLVRDYYNPSCSSFQGLKVFAIGY